MDFSFTQEQQMLLESTRRWLADNYTAAERRRIMDSPEGYSRSVWRQFSELGLLSLNIPERDGGLEAGPVGTLIVATAFGEALVVDPYLSSAVMATRAIDLLGTQQQRSRWLAELAAGEIIAVLAHEEPGATLGESCRLETKAVPSAGGGWRLSGHKSVVYHAPAADILLVSAQIEGRPEWGLFAVPGKSVGVELQCCTTVDGQRAADVRLENVGVPADARLGADASASITRVVAYGLAALCAEALGALEKLLAMTIEYTKTRVQFGSPIGRFQALQHRMVDMLIHVEQARSMAYLAACRCESEEAAEREAALSAAKVVIGNAARFVGQQAVQLHGGMGMTDELAVGHYFKRLLAFELRFGSTAAHVEHYATLV